MNTIHNLLMAVGFVAMFAACGAAFTFGVAMVCRWLSWAPMNIVVNNYQNKPGL